MRCLKNKQDKQFSLIKSHLQNTRSQVKPSDKNMMIKSQIPQKTNKMSSSLAQPAHSRLHPYCSLTPLCCPSYNEAIVTPDSASDADI